MSSQDILVLAEVQRGAGGCHLRVAGRGPGSCGRPRAARSWPWCSAGAGPALRRSSAAADRILLVDDPQLAAYAPEPYVAALAEVLAAEQPRAVLVAATSIGWDLAPMLSARLSAPLVAGCKAVQADGGGLLVTASFCGGKMMADVQVVRHAGNLDVAARQRSSDGRGGQGPGRDPRRWPALEAGAVRFEELILPEAGDVDITQQDVLVAVGGESSRRTNLELAEELAAALGGAVARLAAGHRPGLAAGHAAGGQVGHDRQAAGATSPWESAARRSTWKA